MDVRAGPQRRLSKEESMLLNCVTGEALRVPWTARRSNQSVLKETDLEYSLEGLMLKLKLQYFGLMWRANSLEKTLMVEKIEGRRKRVWKKIRWWYHWLNGHEFEQTPGDSERQEDLACCSPWDQKELDMTEWLNIGFYTHEAELGNVTWFFENIPEVYCKRNCTVAIINKTSHDFLPDGSPESSLDFIQGQELKARIGHPSLQRFS